MDHQQRLADLPGWTEATRAGLFRRRIRIRAEGDRVNAEIEDDVHRFGVDLAHDGSTVTATDSRGHRYPWTICAAAGENFSRVVGAPITTDVTALARWTNAGENCTHRFDIAALAITQAARGPGTRQYDVTVACHEDGTQIADLTRDGTPLLHWSVRGMTIRSTDAAHGHDLRKVLRWAAEALDADAAEAVFVIRRGLLVSHSRAHNVDDNFSLETALSMMAGACYAFQPHTAPGARVNPGNFRDFHGAPERLLDDLES